METRRLAVSLVDRRDGWTIESLSSSPLNPTKFQEDKELGKLEIIRGIWQTSDPNVFERNPTLKHLLISFDSLKISRRNFNFRPLSSSFFKSKLKIREGRCGEKACRD